jgi:ribonuclease P protein component
MGDTPRGFSKEERLKRQQDFGFVFSEGKTVADRWLVLHARPNGLNYNRLGLAVGKKHGPAVARNRLKRLLREAYRTQKPDLPQGYDLVMVPRKNCPGDFGLLRQSVGALLKQVPGVFPSSPVSSPHPCTNGSRRKEGLQ